MNPYEPGKNRNTASSAIRARITIEPHTLFGCNGKFTAFRMVVMHAECRKHYAAGPVLVHSANDPCVQGPDVSDNNYFSFRCQIYDSKVKHPKSH